MTVFRAIEDRGSRKREEGAEEKGSRGGCVVRGGGRGCFALLVHHAHAGGDAGRRREESRAC